eukprot:8186375-Pyramimonas_sp.AAC.1
MTAVMTLRQSRQNPQDEKAKVSLETMRSHGGVGSRRGLPCVSLGRVVTAVVTQTSCRYSRDCGTTLMPAAIPLAAVPQNLSA